MYKTNQDHLDLSLAKFFEVPVEQDLRGHDFSLRHRNFNKGRKKADNSTTQSMDATFSVVKPALFCTSPYNSIPNMFFS